MKNTDHIDQEMKEKVPLFVTGELEENEHKKVFDWISANPENRQLLPISSFKVSGLIKQNKPKRSSTIQSIFVN